VFERLARDSAHGGLTDASEDCVEEFGGEGRADASETVYVGKAARTLKDRKQKR
jgi:hypothetical protein